MPRESLVILLQKLLAFLAESTYSPTVPFKIIIIIPHSSIDLNQLVYEKN
jgi:hypothetical protein